MAGDQAPLDDSTTASYTNSQTAMDSTNPLYMHPSENVGSMLVPLAFDGSGYRSWKRGVLRALSVKNKTGFINGKRKRPDPNSPMFNQWERCDDMVTSWILNSLSKDLEDSLQYVKDAEELWQELEDRYDQTNGAKLYQLQKEINDLTQGSLDITGYYTKMKKLWEELSTLNANARCTCNCTCGAKASMHKAKQDRRLIQFLTGLNELYTIVRGSILMMNPLPSLAQVFSILIQEEKQREMRPQSQLLMESTTLNAGRAGNNNFRNTNGNGYNNFKMNYNQQANNNTGSSVFRGSYPQNRSRLYCEFCKRPGHSKDKCYKLHGYPQNSPQSSQQSRFNKGK
ncbi:uncharacterized protein [Nicotiana tomentosiformis]|uniref:uncharacterized protein n=1 Tax=Nicotiana tomentosiformis TaxID=4098 RepID=UPI00051B7EC0